jgi:hypothetical protein
MILSRVSSGRTSSSTKFTCSRCTKSYERGASANMRAGMRNAVSEIAHVARKKGAGRLERFDPWRLVVTEFESSKSGVREHPLLRVVVGASRTAEAGSLPSNACAQNLILRAISTRTGLSRSSRKNISLVPSGKSLALVRSARAAKRDVRAIVTKRGAGCDGRCGVRRVSSRRTKRR